MSEFITLYPGVYTAREKPFVEKYIADNKVISDRINTDVQSIITGELPKDTPWFGNTIPVTEAMVRYNNNKYDPENPILNDAEYARRLGYKDILAYPSFGAHDDTIAVPYPHGAFDTMLASQLYHDITNYAPVYPGDTLFLVRDAIHFNDLTPQEGSIYRTNALQFEGSVFNQHGEKVSKLIFRRTQGFKLYKDERKKVEHHTITDYWEPPDWLRRPAHYYTDDDWEYIKYLWSQEKRQSANPFYWEDVRIGDEPVWTVDGPIEEGVNATPPWGMGIGGSRTMKKEIMDPKVLRTMIRGKEDGIYRLPNREDYIPPVPEVDGLPKMPMSPDDALLMSYKNRPVKTRSILINYVGRDIAIRHIHNWMGDYGWLHGIRWGIMSPESLAAYGKTVQINPQAERFLEKIPKMKGRAVLTHGLTGDLAIVKSYVYNKYILDGNFFVELAWWIETIDGYIWEEGGATVKLPSRKRETGLPNFAD